MVRLKQLSQEELVRLFDTERKRIIGVNYHLTKKEEAICEQRVKEVENGSIQPISEYQIDQYCHIESPRLPSGNWKLKAHPDLLLDLDKLEKNELDIFVAKKIIGSNSIRGKRSNKRKYPHVGDFDKDLTITFKIEENLLLLFSAVPIQYNGL